jgi:hypothetical protein
MDASDHQLGAVIMQENKPLPFYSCKLNGAQSWYTTGKQGVLLIVETLKEFRNILLGQKLIVHTNHKSILMYGNLSNNRIARWQLLLEEYGPTYVHVKGTDNIVAYALSCTRRYHWSTIRSRWQTHSQKRKTSHSP